MKPVFVTERFTIRELAEIDLPRFAAYRAQPNIAQYQSWSDYALDDAEALFRAMKESPFGTQGDWFQLGITETKSGRLVGDLAICFEDAEQLQVGFTVAPEFQRQGVAHEALRAFLDFAFEELETHRVTATTDARNNASCRLLEKAGFRKEAHFVENVFFKGHWGSEFLYAILRSEWLRP